MQPGFRKMVRTMRHEQEIEDLEHEIARLKGVMGLPGVLALMRRERDNPTLTSEERDQVLSFYAEARHYGAKQPDTQV